MGWIDLYDEKGQRVDLDSLGLVGLKLEIPSPSYALETYEVDGMDGEIEGEQRLLPRNMNAIFWSKGKNYQDSLLVRNELFSFLGGGKRFYIAESHIPGLWWKVRIGAWDPNRINSRIQQIEVPVTAAKGVSESIQKITRTFTDPSILFKNEGRRAINMRFQEETEIEFHGASRNLVIHNKTTGEEWRYTGASTENDIILLKGVRSTKNGNSIFGSTNRKMIGFAPGNNEIEIEGVTGIFTFTIRTRFYFL